MTEDRHACLNEVKSIALRLLEQAKDVAADVGDEPTAQEALGWLVDELDELIIQP